MTTGQRIKQRRKELGLTQEELAKRLGNKTRASVCTVEKDKEDLTTTRLSQYAEALETTPLYLMGLVDSPDLTIEEILKGVYIQSSKNKRILSLYNNAPDDVQLTVENFLIASQQKPDLPHLH